MACALSTGFVLDCKDAIGGVKSVRFATVAQWNALTPTISSGEVTAVGAASLVFLKYDQLKETSSFTDNWVATRNTGGVHLAPSVVVVLPKLKTNKRNEIKMLAQNRLVAIVETMDATPTFWVVGAHNGLDLMEGSSQTGTAASDLNGYTLTFGGLETEQAYSISSAIVTSITNTSQASMA